MRFYTTQQISAKREKTPEGFLLIKDVVVCRTGTQIYGPGECPIPVGPDGTVKIHRDPEEVFRPATMASANLKPLVNNHPDDDVTPDNWRELSYGVFANPRRGLGAEDDVMVMDLLVTDAMGIGLIESGKEELSCGYDAEYEEIGPGEGRQKNIVYNHIALVDSGRCGPRCKISDHNKTHDQCQEESRDMAKVNEKKDLWNRIRRAFKTNDAESLEELESEVTGTSEEPDREAVDGEQHIHLHLPSGGTPGEEVTGDEEEGEPAPKWFKDYADSSEARFKKIEDAMGALGTRGGGGGESEDAAHMGDEEEIEGELEEEAPEGTGDKAAKAKDSIYLGDSFQAAVSMAEIITPGIGIPTFDRKATPKATLAAVHKLRIKCLDLAWNNPQTRDFIGEVTRGRQPDLKKMKVKDVRILFNAVGAAKKRANSSSKDKRVNDGSGDVRQIGSIKNIADLNKRNAEYYKAH